MLSVDLFVVGLLINRLIIFCNNVHTYKILLVHEEKELLLLLLCLVQFSCLQYDLIRNISTKYVVMAGTQPIYEVQLSRPIQQRCSPFIYMSICPSDLRITSTNQPIKKKSYCTKTNSRTPATTGGRLNKFYISSSCYIRPKKARNRRKSYP